MQFVVNANFQYIHYTASPAIPQSPESAADSGAIGAVLLQVPTEKILLWEQKTAAGNPKPPSRTLDWKEGPERHSEYHGSFPMMLRGRGGPMIVIGLKQHWVHPDVMYLIELSGELLLSLRGIIL